MKSDTICSASAKGCLPIPRYKIEQRFLCEIEKQHELSFLVCNSKTFLKVLKKMCVDVKGYLDIGRK